MAPKTRRQSVLTFSVASWC